MVQVLVLKTLWKRVKIKCIREGITASDFVRRAIRNEVLREGDLEEDALRERERQSV